MGWFDRLLNGPQESRASLENPSVGLGDERAWSLVWGGGMSSSGVDVTPAKALGVPAVWGAVNFIASTFAGLPLQLFRRTDNGREVAATDPLYAIVHDVVNDDYLTSFAWRKQAMTQVLIDGGRSYTYIERNKAGRVANLWPLDPSKVTVRRMDGYRSYVYRQTTREVEYTSDEIIDVPFLMEADGITHCNPVSRLKNAIGLALALEDYAAKFFQNGGVPPLVLSGPRMSPAAANRAAADVKDAQERAWKEQRNVLVIPEGHELKAVGVNPEQGQLVEARTFQLLEIARIYGLPPTFLQDLQYGTFSNTEQQDLQFVKHTLTQWLAAWEAEMNAKLFGPRNRKSYVEFNTDGLLRGDFKTRMDGYARGIGSAVLTPNEARAMENRPDEDGGDKLYIQGATVPLDKAGQQTQPAPAPVDPNANPDGGADVAA